jgi:hypothetical protein
MVPFYPDAAMAEIEQAQNDSRRRHWLPCHEKREMRDARCETEVAIFRRRMDVP